MDNVLAFSRDGKKRGLRMTAGYTLLEVMLVVIIIGILVSAAVVRFTGRQTQAAVGRAKADIDANISTALKLYEMDNGRFPTTEQGLKALVQQPSSDPAPKNWRRYLEKGAVPKDPWQNEYIYICPGKNDPEGYDLSSRGPDGQEGTSDDVMSWSTGDAAP